MCDDKISIVVPVYNVEKYLECCIESLLNQTYSNIEIILIDDGSTDSSPQICDLYSKKNQKIRVVHKQNEGLGYARNSGIEHALGQYITFVDSDDFVKNNYIEKMYKLLVENNADVSMTSYYKWHNEDSIDYVKKNEGIVVFEKKKIVKEFIPRLFGRLPNTNDTYPMSATMSLFSMDIISSFNIRFPSEREYICEDMIFDINYLSHSNRLVSSEYAGYYYRDTEQSLTTKYIHNRFEKYVVLYLEEQKLLSAITCNTNYQLRLDWQLFIHTKVSIKQEIDKYGLFSVDSIKNTKKVFNNELLVDVINQYPIRKTDFFHREFLYCVKYKWVIFACSLIKLDECKDKFLLSVKKK